ncbi:MAG: hypothetical protein JWS12_219 [Candidatus Saccharibacteria bacterium]|nr:hypothetical protein [Candidatus Saccharibacteria bacterium]
MSNEQLPLFGTPDQLQSTPVADEQTDSIRNSAPVDPYAEQQLEAPEAVPRPAARPRQRRPVYELPRPGMSNSPRSLSPLEAQAGLTDAEIDRRHKTILAGIAAMRAAKKDQDN